MVTFSLKLYDSRDVNSGYVISASGPLGDPNEEREAREWFRDNDISVAFMIGGLYWFAISDPIFDEDTICLAKIRFT
jgi:hypothetical protein